MTVSAWRVYSSFIPKMDSLDTDTFKCALFTSTYVPADTDDSYSALTGEVANGSGYTTGGTVLTGVTLTETAGVWTFDFNTIDVFTATGADVICKTAVIYNDTDTGKQLVAVMYLDTVYDVKIPDGFPLTIMNPDGVFTVGGW